MGIPIMYVGETEEVLQRFDNHYRDKNEDKDKNFWQQAIIFIGQGDILDKAKVRYLEAELVKLARDNKRCNLKNKTNPMLSPQVIGICQS